MLRWRSVCLFCCADAEGDQLVQWARHQCGGQLQPGGRLSPGVLPERGGELPDTGQQHAWEDTHRSDSHPLQQVTYSSPMFYYGSAYDAMLRLLMSCLLKNVLCTFPRLHSMDLNCQNVYHWANTPCLLVQGINLQVKILVWVYSV